MLPFTSNSACYLTSHRPFSRLNYPVISCTIHNPKKMTQACKRSILCRRAFGFCGAGMDKRVVGGFDGHFCCSCSQKEGDFELESAIIEFMDKSERPTMFPTREELIGAGRMDLVEAIRKIGGWYTLGWSEENMGDNVDDELDFDIIEFQRRIGNRKGSDSLEEERANRLSGGEKENGFSPSLDSNSKNLDSLQLASPSSSSGRLLHRESNTAEDSGIESILNGLEKQRNSDFGLTLGKYGDEKHATSERDYDDFSAPFDASRGDHGREGRPRKSYNNEGVSNEPHEKVHFKPETWRTWSNHRAGALFSEFEAAEISYGKNSMKHDEETYSEGLTSFTRGYSDALDRAEDSSHNQIRTRLQYLEFELSKALHSLRSNREEISLKEVNSRDSVVGGSVIDLQKLSDEQEFQENEVMSAKERLRSIRANLAILEGKMAMAMNDSQKLLEEKQKQIEGSHRAFQLLRTTHIVWHNSASEVLLTGSFDGWTSQREMEKLETGVFSASLMLYPGRYEIKFIVDGLWKVDPLRPIVKSSGHENNLLIVT